jgi:heme exporter protein A
MLQVRSLTARRGMRQVFRQIDFSIAWGGALIVTGRNGSGKSTLLRIIAGLLPATAGDIIWQDNTVRHDAYDLRAAINYIGHLDALKAELTVAEQIKYWRALDPAFAGADIKTVLVPLRLEKLHDKPVRYLSAGQKRRLSLTRLAMKPAQLWLLDEPATALDADSQQDLIQMIETHRAKGGGVIIATHQTLPLHDAITLIIEGVS